MQDKHCKEDAVAIYFTLAAILFVLGAAYVALLPWLTGTQYYEQLFEAALAVLLAFILMWKGFRMNAQCEANNSPKTAEQLMQELQREELRKHLYYKHHHKARTEGS